MSDQTLYWHDYETFGADPRRDRPAQFAGLRTSLDLNPIGDPLVLYCRPSPDMLPVPEACLITGITPQLAGKNGLPEVEFITHIHRELSRPGTCALGYNTLRFDDELTRHTLYRNLMDPYQREWRNGNSRWDLIDTVRMTAALRPEGLTWPRDDQGKPSFKLELLTEANGISHVGAHDALADVRATIELARLLKERQPKLFEFSWRNRGKREAAELLRIGEFEPVVHVSEKYPAEKGCLAVVIALGFHPINRNEVIVFDLGTDPSALFDEDAEAIRQRLFTRQADLPEGLERIAIKTVHLNRCPVLAPVSVLRPVDRERLGIDWDRCLKNRDKIRKGPCLERKLADVFAARTYPESESDDPDLMLYRGGFFSDTDRSEMTRIHDVNPDDLVNHHPVFDDARLDEMYFRFRARNYPDSLTADEAARWEAFRRRRLSDKSVGGTLTLEEYRERLLALEAGSLAPQQKAIIEALRDWDREISS